MNDVDRVRQELGLSARADAPVGSEHAERLDVRDVINRSADTSTVPVLGLGLLRTLSWLALAAGGVAALLHRRVWSWVASLDQSIVAGAARTVLEVGHAPLWVPWAAGIAAGGLLALAIPTRGFTRATQGQILTMTVLDIGALAMATPLAVATAIGIAFFAVAVPAVALLLVAVGALLLAGGS